MVGAGGCWWVLVGCGVKVVWWRVGVRCDPLQGPTQGFKET